MGALNTHYKAHSSFALCTFSTSEKGERGIRAGISGFVDDIEAVTGKPCPAPAFIVTDRCKALLNVMLQTYNGRRHGYKEHVEMVSNALDHYFEKCRTMPDGWSSSPEGYAYFMTLLPPTMAFPCIGHYLRSVADHAIYGAGFKGNKHARYYRWMLTLIHHRIVQSPMFAGPEKWPSLKELVRLFTALFSAGATWPVNSWVVEDFAYVRSATESDKVVGKLFAPSYVLEVAYLGVMWLSINIYANNVGEISGDTWELSVSDAEAQVLAQVDKEGKQAAAESQCASGEVETGKGGDHDGKTAEDGAEKDCDNDISDIHKLDHTDSAQYVLLPADVDVANEEEDILGYSTEDVTGLEQQRGAGSVSVYFSICNTLPV